MSTPEHIRDIIPRVDPVRIVIPGPPATYQKHVGTWHSRDGRFGTHAYDQKGYRIWRDYARGRAAEICEKRPVSDEAVRVVIQAFFLPPKSMSQKKLLAATSDLLRPTVKDCDNIAKAVADACLTGIVIRDDRQIVSLRVEKMYSDNPRVEVEIWPWVPEQRGSLL